LFLLYEALLEKRVFFFVSRKSKTISIDQVSRQPQSQEYDGDFFKKKKKSTEEKI
jgi:hypothetical protein